MRLLVLGATGGTGMEIVRQASEQGHTVTALVRSPERLSKPAHQISIVQGDLLDEHQLTRVLEGQDAVLSAFGPRVPVSKADAHLLKQFAVTLTAAMKRSGVRRILFVSVAFLFKNAVFPPAYVLGRLLFPKIVADAAAAESVIQASALDWTIVRPPELTDKPYTGKYRVRSGHLPVFGLSISRADVADFILKTADEPSTIGIIYGISN